MAKGESLGAERLRMVAMAMFVMAFASIPAAALTVDSCTGSTGSAAGGDTVVITGTGFDDSGTTQVFFEFGQNAATNVHVFPGGSYLSGDETVLICTTPPGVAGSPGTITVINPDFSFATSGIPLFEYVNSPPVITRLGLNPVLSPLGQAYADAGASAVDGNGADITGSIITTGTVDINTIDVYTIEYNVMDGMGAPASPVQRKVYVEPTGPVGGVIGSGGGTVSRPGIDVSVPSGSTSGSAVITVEHTSTATGGPGAALTWTLTGLDDLDNGTVVTITLEYPDGDQDGVVDGTFFQEENVALFVSPGSQIIAPISVDALNNTATFEIVVGGAKGVSSEIEIELGSSEGAVLPLHVIGVLAAAICCFVVFGLLRLSRRFAVAS